ncbi:MAG: hypothetical protein ABH804_02395 [archaeon]
MRTKKISKLLSILLFSLTMWDSCPVFANKDNSITEFPKKPFIGQLENFRNYKTKDRKPIKVFSDFFGIPAFFLLHDTNKDKMIDVIEGYRVLTKVHNPDKPSVTIYFLNGPYHPFLYGFDCNKNGIIELDEFFIDLEQDGFNGNEVPWEKYKNYSF